MKLFINHRSGVPIYLQLIQQIERGIAGGILEPGEQLPTVREMALELTVNPNTIARAYRELEVKGLIESIQGKGTFVSRKTSLAAIEKEKIIQEKINDLRQEAYQLGLTSSQLKKIFLDTLKEFENGGAVDE